ncbi:MAG: hypothetical protein ACR2PY_00880 [Salinispira sp.]
MPRFFASDNCSPVDPKLLSITQSNEYGQVYSIEKDIDRCIAELAKYQSTTSHP